MLAALEAGSREGTEERIEGMETRERVRKGACQRGGTGSETAGGCSGEDAGESASPSASASGDSRDGLGVDSCVGVGDANGVPGAVELGLASGDLPLRSRSFSRPFPKTLFLREPLRFLRCVSAIAPAIALRLFSGDEASSLTRSLLPVRRSFRRLPLIDRRWIGFCFFGVASLSLVSSLSTKLRSARGVLSLSSIAGKGDVSFA